MKHIAAALAAEGRNGDTELLHVAPWEIEHLRGIAALHGGDLTRNPKTGLMEASFFTNLRDALETGGALVGNYYLPGSSLLTSNLTSQGSQKQLHSPLGMAAQLGTGLVGAGVGAGTTGLPQSPVFTATAPAAGTAAPTAGGIPSAIPGQPALNTGSSFMQPNPITGTMGAPTPSAVVEPGYKTMGRGALEAGSWMADHPIASAMGIAGLGTLYSAMHPPGQPTHNVHMIGTATPNDKTKLTADQQAWNAAHTIPGQAQYYLNPDAGYTVGPGYDVTMPGYAEGGSIKASEARNFYSGIIPKFLVSNSFADAWQDRNIRARGGQPSEIPEAAYKDPRPNFFTYINPDAWNKFVDQQHEASEYMQNQKEAQREAEQGYARGGITNLNPTFLQGDGDGMSDSIPAAVHHNGGKEPVRLANNEYIVPADVVSHLGNGSSAAGAKVLDKMSSNVRKARTGKTKQAPKINPHKYTPA